MKAYIALFRGINVGGKNILPMKDLVEILEKMDCTGVRTYIQSGNAVFRIKNEQKELTAAGIGSKILESHGFEPKVLLLEESEFQNAIDNNPFQTDNGKALHLFFLDSPPKSPDLEALMSVKSSSEEFELIDKVFYLFAPDGIGRSKLAAKVEKWLGVPATARNWNTVRKLSTMFENRAG